MTRDSTTTRCRCRSTCTGTFLQWPHSTERAFSPVSLGEVLTEFAECRVGRRSTRSRSACIGPTQEKTSVLGLSAGPLGPRYGQPVLIPHAPSTKGPAINRGPERGQNPPDSFRVLCGSSSSTLGRPTVVFRSASRPQVGGLTSDSSLAGHGPLIKAPQAVFPQSGVGRFVGIGIARPEESEGWLGSMNGAATLAAME
jgi:hypothetical protein